MKDGTELNPVLIILAIALVVCAALWKLVAPNADFFLTVSTIFGNALTLVAGWAIWRFTPLNVVVLASAFPSVAWPMWWPVLESSANREGQSGFGFLRGATAVTSPPLDVWWDSAWFKWGVEATFVGLLCGVVYFVYFSERNRYYRY